MALYEWGMGKFKTGLGILMTTMVTDDGSRNNEQDFRCHMTSSMNFWLLRAIIRACTIHPALKCQSNAVTINSSRQKSQGQQSSKGKG